MSWRKLLYDTHPVIVIGGEKHHYGYVHPDRIAIEWGDVREKTYWLIEHEWCEREYVAFGSREKMIEFLEDLSDDPEWKPDVEAVIRTEAATLSDEIRELLGPPLTEEQLAEINREIDEAERKRRGVMQ